MFTKEQKKNIVSEIDANLNSSKAVVFFDYQKISTLALNAFRDKLFTQKAKFSIYKNTLLQKVLKEKITQEFKGPTAVLFANEDPVAPIKELYNFKKDNESIDIKFGFLEGKLVSAVNLATVSQLPAKEELLAKVVGGMKAPIYNFVGSLRVINKFVAVLSNIAKGG